MKKITFSLVIAAFALAMSVGVADAALFTFDSLSFLAGSTAIGNYMTVVNGSNVSVSGATVGTDLGNPLSNYSGDMFLFTSLGSGGSMDFTFAVPITEVAFDWAVMDATTGQDFRALANGVEFFSMNTGTGSGSYNIVLASAATTLRFSDSGLYDVGIDNLRVGPGNTSASPVPEPASMMLLGTGLLGLFGLRKKVA